MKTQLRIESDGTPHGTRVYTPEGEDITNCVVAIKWELRAGSREAAVAIEFAPPEISVNGNLRAAEISQELMERLRAEQKSAERERVLQQTRRDLPGVFHP